VLPAVAWVSHEWDDPDAWEPTEDWGDILLRRQVSPVELAQLAAHGCV
jgi:hypothetical protein